MNEAEDDLPAIQLISKNLQTELLLAFLIVTYHAPAVPPTNVVRKRKECSS
jgi:hypothetical protein